MAVTDKSNMRSAILEFPKQFKMGLKSAEKTKAQGSFDGVVVCGMGGSALPADILKVWLKAHKIGLPLYIHRDYNLPQRADERNLIVCISYSGNTEETLSCFNEARKRNLKIATITSGGKLEKLCKKNNIPLALIPSGFQPRMAVGLQLAALIKTLVNCGILKNSLDNLVKLENRLHPQKLEAQGRVLAKKLKNKIPLVYSSERMATLARIWKIKFNENAKIPAFHNYFPELNHNEHNQFEGPETNKLHVVILRDKADLPRIQKRMKLLYQILKKRKIAADFIDIKGKDVLYKIFYTLLIGDWASYYLALSYGIDPTPTKLNDEFKKRMAQR